MMRLAIVIILVLLLGTAMVACQEGGGETPALPPSQDGNGGEPAPATEEPPELMIINVTPDPPLPLKIGLPVTWTVEIENKSDIHATMIEACLFYTYTAQDSGTRWGQSVITIAPHGHGTIEIGPWAFNNLGYYALVFEVGEHIDGEWAVYDNWVSSLEVETRGTLIPMP